MNRSRPYKQQFTLSVGDEQVATHLQISLRKSMKLQLNSAGEIDVHIPFGMDQGQVLAFLTKHQSWLVEQRQRFLQQQQQQTEFFYWQGREIHLAASCNPRPIMAENTWFYPERWSTAQLLKNKESFLRAQAASAYQEMIDQWWPFFASYGGKPQLRIKKMRTRWGSLSKRGYINLNLALVCLPRELQELVIVHELCHLKHFNHGAGFKTMLKQCLPAVDRLEQELAQWEKRVLLIS